MIVRAKCQDAANDLLKHGVPPMKEACGPSGSIVFRKIKTVLPWDKVRKKMKSAKTNRLKRKLKRQERPAKR